MNFPSLALLPSILLAAMALHAHGDPADPGVTYRLYDIREPMDQLYPLVPGQTPNVDERRATVDWSGSAALSGYTQQFMVEVSADLSVTAAGDHEFRLTSEDGSELWIADTLVVDHDGEHAATSKNGSITLNTGLHPLRIRFFLNTGTPVLKLEWRSPGDAGFSVVPETRLSTPGFVTRVVAPGKKEIITPGDGTRPGNGAPLTAAHPEWEVRTIRPSTFKPKVGAMAVHPDGRLFVATFNPNQNSNSSQPTTPNGKIWALTNVNGNDPEAVGVTEVATGLFEPAGMTFVDGVLYVSQRLELTRLLDNNGDGFYETHQTVGGGWVSNNYHMFNFGLIAADGYAYSALSTSINFSYTGLNGPNPANRGTWVRTNLATGAVDFLAGGLRTPNGIGFGPDGDIFQTDNQGSWLPASRLNHLREGRFYGHYNNTADGGVASLHSDQPPTPAAVYLPQNEISNSPTQPLLMPEGRDFAGDMLLGELTLGGINRVSLEKVNGEWQGAVYRFSQGFEAGVNRIEWAPDGSLYVGCIGASGNWSWNGTTSGLQRLSPKAGALKNFEIDRVEATTNGFRIRYTKPVPAATLNNPANFTIRQWTYSPSQVYGGSKVNETTLPVTTSAASPDRKSVELTVPGLSEGYVVYLKSDLVSDFGEAIWSSEAWYTLNAVPGRPFDLQLDAASVAENEPSGTAVGQLTADHDDPATTIQFSLPAGQLQNAFFSITGDTLVTATPFDYERRNSYPIRVRATDGAGNFSEADFIIAVTDLADESAPHRIMLTNAVLPPDHASGALVGNLLIDDVDLGDLTAPSGGSGFSEPVAYDGFDYLAGAGLGGQAGGTGFTGTWGFTGAGTVATIPSGSLGYTDSQGLSLNTTGNRALAGNPTSRNHRPLAAARGADGTVTYLSFLADPNPNAFFWGVEFWNGTAADSNRVLQIGNESGFGVRVRNTTNKFFAFSDDDPHFFVIRIDHLSGNDLVSVWIDPPLSAEPPAADLFFSSAETGGSIVFNRLGFTDAVNKSAPTVDEIRLGNDWASVTPHSVVFPSFELVAGEGDDDNASFAIQDSSLRVNGVLPLGLHTVRVRVTDSAGLAYEQPVLIWVGAGHTDSNGDGISDGDAVRLGFDPAGPDATAAYFGSVGGFPVLEWSAALDGGLLGLPSIPGNLYWLEASSDLLQWQLVPDSVRTPDSFLDVPSLWQPAIPEIPRHFWRASGGWPDALGEDPLASGLAGLTFVGGSSAGWTYDPATGILKQDAANPNPAQWLHFGDTYTDFLLSLEYRVSANGNAGVFLRAAATGNPWETGTEIQITTQPREAIHSTGAAYGRIAANPAADATPGVWHRMEILMIDQRLRVRVDGVAVIDVADVQAAYPGFNWPTTGMVGLQDAHTSGSTIEYRELRLLPLAP